MGGNKKIRLRFCDSMGLEGGDDGIKATDIAKIMDGHVMNGSEVSWNNFSNHLFLFLFQLSKGGLVPGSEGYNTNPTDNDRMHCVVLVINAMTVSTMDESVEKKIKDIREEADQRSK